MKILVFCPNWIGDVVMATPTLRSLHNHFPDAHLAGVMRPYVAEVLAGNPRLDATILCDRRSSDLTHRPLEVTRRLRREGFDLAVLLTNSFRSALLAWLGGAKRRVGYGRDGRWFLLNDRISAGSPFARRRPSPVIDYYLRIAEHVGAPSDGYQMDLYTTEADEAAADDLWRRHELSDQEVVALNPGAAFGPAKRWPSHYFSELARRLVDERGVKVLVLCGPKERGFARFITDASFRPRQVRSLADEPVSIGLTKALIRRSRLLVSTDSGPRHFAAAFGVPVVSLFGPTHIEWTETYFEKETTLQKKLSCGPCQQRVCPLGHHRCMQELAVEEVFVAALKRLNEGDASTAAA
ncbi:ADP-heptose--LPS heptosyltransferase 2 [Planctomycetes bacterium Pan216]|uniref:lipopolysaccharide heptosyltransferase II n=1 Tax=Kolteria novifilia TaxID=2527975 RepID=A0A518AYM4_9BACT|nr:ADP-heptose--LPS heptosyltransferase 2 [Planctomycetes bacterium Pan216]